MSPAIRSKGLSTRSFRAYLQLGLAVLGMVVIIWGVFGLATSVSLPRSDSGFAEGLGIIFYGVYVLGGFVVLAAGLLVPQRDDSGIRFSAHQRKLLAYGVVAPIVSVLVIPIGATVSPPLTEPVIDVLVAVLAALILSGPLATMTALGLKLHSHRQ
ncbi:hypothetical protein [Halobellus limi]|uniref:Uncharacterized protein n=2 Tax=Halobellus limi TaxID=699433 RepID=A0A1H6CF57_9EURY|nr:hypothetical protein [Halobellus limi]SEG71594.1 hypothetical protein SAMN04488133_3416 [Halobellus limi]